MNISKRCHLIPSDELRCVWMEAGLLAYQLCDRMFECDACPLDAVMHRRLPEAAGDRKEGHAAPAAGDAEAGCLPEGYRFSRNHWWLRATGPSQARLGIEAGLARALLAVKGIVSPSPQQRLHRGQACAWVIMDGGTLALEAPVDGIVRGINHGLIDAPHLLGQRAFDEGWLCDVEAEGLESASLMDAREARPVYALDRARFSTSLGSALRGRRPPVGETLADGGELLQSYADILGPARYIALVRQAFSRPKK